MLRAALALLLLLPTTFAAVRGADDPEPTVRGKKASEWLEMLQKDPNVDRRRAAVIALEILGSKVPGVRSAARYRLEHSTVPGMQRYLTIYELDSPDVMKSAAWEKAGAYGDWATKIRPLLTGRHHTVFERIA